MTQIELDSGVSSPGMPTNARTAFPATGVSTIRSQRLGPLRLSDGTVLPRPVIAYELTGPEAGPLIVTFGGISAHRHVTAPEHDSPRSNCMPWARAASTPPRCWSPCPPIRWCRSSSSATSPSAWPVRASSSPCRRATATMRSWKEDDALGSVLCHHLALDSSTRSTPQ